MTPVDLNDPSLSEADKQEAVEQQYNAKVERQMEEAKVQEELETVEF